MRVRHWFRIDREWVQKRDALLRSEEDRLFREARERASGAERAFLDELIAERARNAAALKGIDEGGNTA
jgi:hypothetical protein